MRVRCRGVWAGHSSPTRLELGCDCLGHIHYFDVRSPTELRQAGRHEECDLPARGGLRDPLEDYEFRNETFEVRRSRRLVISFFTTVGNYDYGFFWYFYQDGTIQLEVKLTGIIQTAAIRAGRVLSVGGMVAEDLGVRPTSTSSMPPAHDAGR